MYDIVRLDQLFRHLRKDVEAAQADVGRKPVAVWKLRGRDVEAIELCLGQLFGQVDEPDPGNMFVERVIIPSNMTED